jgi:hypothetical protein
MTGNLDMNGKQILNVDGIFVTGTSGNIASADALNQAVDAASTSANDAHLWATSPEDSQVTDSQGKSGYSALHYSNKAEQHANSAQVSASNAATSEANAANSAAAAATSAANAAASAANAQAAIPDFQQDSGTTTGLTFGYKAGKFRNDNAIVSVAAGTVTLTGSATNYVEVDSAGVVSVNTTGFTSGSIPLFEVVTTSGTISSVTDKRSCLLLGVDANNVSFNDSDAQLGVSSTQEAINIIASRTQNTDFIYGIRWDYVNDIIQPGYVNFAGTFIPNDYTVFPIQEKAARVLLDNKGNERILNIADSSKFPDGTDAPIDGSGGHTMVRIPKFYLLTYTSGNYHYILNSESPFRFNGYTAWIPQAFGNLEYRHIGAYEGTAMSDSLNAQVGSVVNAVHHPNGLNTSGYTVNPYPAPFANRTRGQFRTQCNNGVFKQFSWGDLEILQILFYTKYKTLNSQAVLPGYTWRSAWNYADATKPGITYSLGNQDGYITDANGNVIANSFLGVENFFGNIWKWVDGINIYNVTGAYDVYVCHDPANFADDTSTNYSLLTGTTDFGDADGYITNLLMNSSKLGSFFPTSITGGSSSEFACDYMWNAAGGLRVLQSGGSLYAGAQAGVACLSADNSSGALTSSIGARLAGYV